MDRRVAGLKFGSFNKTMRADGSIAAYGDKARV
jgi:hypothetical protein